MRLIYEYFQRQIFQQVCIDVPDTWILRSYPPYVPCIINTFDRTWNDEQGNSNFVCVGEYPTLTKASARFYYQPLLSVIVKLLGAIPLKKFYVTCGEGKFECNRNKSRSEFEETLLAVQRATSATDVLIKITKRQPSSAILRTAVSMGNEFVGVFLSNAMPFAEACYKHHQLQVQSILKQVQQTTRQLNALCAYGKPVTSTTIYLIASLRYVYLRM